VTKALAEGSTFPEVIAMETTTEEVEIAIPVAGVPEGAVPDPEAPVAPEITTRIHVDVLSESSMDVVKDR
jgi:hypothetical protein